MNPIQLPLDPVRFRRKVQMLTKRIVTIGALVVAT